MPRTFVVALGSGPVGDLILRMTDSLNPERLLVENLSLIDRVSATMARRQGLDADEAADLNAWIRLKLVENDYATLRKFRGDSALGTYLTVVVTMLARDHHVQERGRWRPSAAALRQGPLAVRLETLVYRRGYALSEAIRVLQTTGESTLSDAELRAQFTALPRRVPMRPTLTNDTALETTATPEQADSRIEANEIAQERARIETIVTRWLADLPIDERVMLRMRFWQSMSVAEIARGLRVEQKPLYRQLDRLLQRLRTALLAEGVTASLVSEYFNESEP